MNDTQGTLYTCLARITDLYGSAVSDEFAHHAIDRYSDYIELHGHTLLYASGVWWYKD